jgi:hypothetical protein
LRLSKADFWSLTWGEFYECLYRWEEEQYRQDIRFGVMASTYINVKLQKDAEPFTAEQCFGYDEEREIGGDELAARIKSKIPKTGTYLEKE